MKANGTGFFVDWSGFVLTARHVVEGQSDIDIIDSGGKKHHAQIIQVGSHDVALLKANGRPPSIVPFKSAVRPELGESLFTVGFPFDPEGGGEGRLEFAEGALTAYSSGPNGRLFQFSAPIRAGNSGGAIVNDSGTLVGVAVAGYDPVRTFVETGKTAVLMSLGEWADEALLLFPAGWSQKNAPSVHNRKEAIKNLRLATVKVQIYDAESVKSP